MGALAALATAAQASDSLVETPASAAGWLLPPHAEASEPCSVRGAGVSCHHAVHDDSAELLGSTTTTESLETFLRLLHAAVTVNENVSLVHQLANVLMDCVHRAEGATRHNAASAAGVSALPAPVVLRQRQLWETSFASDILGSDKVLHNWSLLRSLSSNSDEQLVGAARILTACVSFYGMCEAPKVDTIVLLACFLRLSRYVCWLGEMYIQVVACICVSSLSITVWLTLGVRLSWTALLQSSLEKSQWRWIFSSLLTKTTLSQTSMVSKTLDRSMNMPLVMACCVKSDSIRPITPLQCLCQHKRACGPLCP